MTTDLERLEALCKLATPPAENPRSAVVTVWRDDLLWFTAELRAALAAVHDLRLESAAYRRGLRDGAEDMRGRAAGWCRGGKAVRWDAAAKQWRDVYADILALPLTPEGP